MNRENRDVIFDNGLPVSRERLLAMAASYGAEAAEKREQWQLLSSRAHVHPAVKASADWNAAKAESLAARGLVCLLAAAIHGL